MVLVCGECIIKVDVQLRSLDMINSGTYLTGENRMRAVLYRFNLAGVSG